MLRSPDQLHNLFEDLHRARRFNLHDNHLCNRIVAHRHIHFPNQQDNLHADQYGGPLPIHQFNPSISLHCNHSSVLQNNQLHSLTSVQNNDQVVNQILNHPRNRILFLLSSHLTNHLHSHLKIQHVNHHYSLHGILQEVLLSNRLFGHLPTLRLNHQRNLRGSHLLIQLDHLVNHLYSHRYNRRINRLDILVGSR